MMRVGQGFDVHGFDLGRPLILGGIEVEGSPGLSGHSDADVLSHAIADALLGAAALGDLGGMFPADERWAGASSLDILRASAAAGRDAGWSVASVDSTIVAERPKLASYIPRMRTEVAGALGVDVSLVSVKATTTDGLGFTGRGEGIAAMAVVLLGRA